MGLMAGGNSQFSHTTAEKQLPPRSRGPQRPLSAVSSLSSGQGKEEGERDPEGTKVDVHKAGNATVPEMVVHSGPSSLGLFVTFKLEISAPCRAFLPQISNLILHNPQIPEKMPGTWIWEIILCPACPVWRAMLKCLW